MLSYFVYGIDQLFYDVISLYQKLPCWVVMKERGHWNSVNHTGHSLNGVTFIGTTTQFILTGRTGLKHLNMYSQLQQAGEAMLSVKPYLFAAGKVLF